MTSNDDLPILPTDQERLTLLEPKALPDRVSDLFRDSILTGRLRPGTRLVEQKLAERLSMSRVPIREALIKLEKEGLIVSRPNGKYVVELGEQDFPKVYAVRSALERLAVELATKSVSRERASALRRRMEQMKEAGARQDAGSYIKYDFELHQLIWQQSDNHYLLDALRTLTGPIYMFIADNATHFGWGETLELHEDLVNSIVSGDTARALASFERHMQDALARASRVFDRRREA